MSKTIKMLVKEPNKEAYIKEVEDKLENLQAIVGGLIECVQFPLGHKIDMYVNEEGKLENLTGNFWMPEYEDFVAGTCYFVGIDYDNGENISITDKQIELCKKYVDLYEIPECADVYTDFAILKECMEQRYKFFNRKVAELWELKEKV